MFFIFLAISTAPSLSGSNLQQVAGTTEVRPMYPRTQYTISRAHVTLDQAGDLRFSFY